MPPCIKNRAPEDDLFRQGLNGLAVFFSHPNTYCFQVTKFPAGYPHGYNIPQGSNVALYHDRGWPFVEHCLINLSKIYYMTNDISRERFGTGPTKHRVAPMTPETVEERLQLVTFTNAEQDRPVVLQLYKNELARRMEKARTLSYLGLKWRDDDLVHLASVIGSSTYGTPNLERLDLGRNRFGLQGCQALAKALLERALNNNPHSCAPLKSLDMKSNKNIGDTEVKIMAPALIQKCEEVDLSGCSVGVEGCRALAEAARAYVNDGDSSSSRVFALNYLHLSGNENVGDNGLSHLLASPLVAHMKALFVSYCGLTDKACRGLHDALVNERSAPSPLEYLGLAGNSGITGASLPLLCGMLQHCPNMIELAVNKIFQDDRQKLLLAASGNPQKIRINFQG